MSVLRTFQGNTPSPMSGVNAYAACITYFALSYACKETEVSGFSAPEKGRTGLLPIEPVLVYFPNSVGALIQAVFTFLFMNNFINSPNCMPAQPGWILNGFLFCDLT